MDYSHYEYLIVEKKEKVAIVTLNRPESLNSINKYMHHELAQITLDLDEDEDVNAVILTGAGRGFSVGGDIAWMEDIISGTENRMKIIKFEQNIIKNLVALRKPLIAAVTGPCMGLGASIALHCDIILAVPKAKFADPHVKVGLVAGDGGPIIWPLNTSLCKAKEYLMTGKHIAAPEAERIGLINHVVDPENLMDEAWKFAKEFADGATWAVSWTKVCINKIIEERINLLFDAMVQYEFNSIILPDHKEAQEAFMAKRDPKFKGANMSGMY